MVKEVNSDKQATEAPVPSVPRSEEARASIVKPVVQEAPMLVNFDRWFSAKQFKPQWKEGMQAYADTTGRRSMDEWDKLFLNY